MDIMTYGMGMMRIFFIIVPIFVVLVFAFTIAIIVSPKFKAKIMSRQIKATKKMIDYSKDDLTSMGTAMGNISIQTKKNILDENEDSLRDMATREANISKKGIEITANAIKKGLTEDNTQCKHCGTSIDKDSKFCKKCGKNQLKFNYIIF